MLFHEIAENLAHFFFFFFSHKKATTLNARNPTQICPKGVVCLKGFQKEITYILNLIMTGTPVIALLRTFEISYLTSEIWRIQTYALSILAYRIFQNYGIRALVNSIMFVFKIIWEFLLGHSKFHKSSWALLHRPNGGPSRVKLRLSFTLFFS